MSYLILLAVTLEHYKIINLGLQAIVFWAISMGVYEGSLKGFNSIILSLSLSIICLIGLFVVFKLLTLNDLWFA